MNNTSYFSNHSILSWIREIKIKKILFTIKLNKIYYKIEQTQNYLKKKIQ